MRDTCAREGTVSVCTRGHDGLPAGGADPVSEPSSGGEPSLTFRVKRRKLDRTLWSWLKLDIIIVNVHGFSI